MALKNLQSLWIPIEKELQLKRLKPLTIKNRYYSLRLLAKLTNITGINSLGKIEIARDFLSAMEEKAYKDRTMRVHLLNLSTTVDYLLKKQEFENKRYGLKANPFEYLLDTTHFNDDIDSHPVRTKEEVELWISTIPRLDYQLVYALGAMGLRRHEIFLLKKSQFNLVRREITNVKRKGRKMQKRLGIPIWILDMLNIHLKRLDKDALLFEFDHKSLTWYFAKNHFTDLQLMAFKIENSPKLMDKWNEIYQVLSSINDKGQLTLHSLRATWDTLSSGKMKDVFRKYHMNHALGGMDDTYVQLQKNEQKFREYIEDMDINSPQYEFKEI